MAVFGDKLTFFHIVFLPEMSPEGFGWNRKYPLLVLLLHRQHGTPPARVPSLPGGGLHQIEWHVAPGCPPVAAKRLAIIVT